MPVPVHTPRLNNNDDFVRVAFLHVPPGSAVRRGDPIADLETDKATFTVEAEQDGYLLRFRADTGETIAVGSILAWMGESADEPAPEDAPLAAVDGSAGRDGRSPTLKAALLLAQFGLTAAEVPASGDRLSAADVERYLASRPAVRSQPAAQQSFVAPLPAEPGRSVELSRAERGMLQTVLWQREAVPAYIEISYDPKPWDEYAAEFQKRHRILMSPLLALLVWRLVRIAADRPAINATVAGAGRHVYDHVNLGFTVQSGPDLYAVVVREAETLDAPALVSRLGELQRSAMRGTLQPSDVSGATIGFSSMARWSVTRHVPVLLPQTAVMIAHSAPSGATATLGATYDHRLLHGADVFKVLQMLAMPPEQE
jgi:pyruvate dehydrogenase E2 component (dihydrolipoamide acetyltransferase)